MFKISVLVSGSGSTLNNLCFHCYDQNDGIICGCVGIERVVSDRSGVKALEVAERWGIPTLVIPQSDFKDKASWSEAIFANDVDLHVMAGFLPHVLVPTRCEGRVLNMHPSYLPAFGGKGMYKLKVHQAVIDSGANTTGCTVHVVDNEYDHGPIVEQVKVAVLATDTPESLQHAVQTMENRLYPRAILNYLRKR